MTKPEVEAARAAAEAALIPADVRLIASLVEGLFGLNWAKGPEDWTPRKLENVMDYFLDLFAGVPDDLTRVAIREVRCEGSEWFPMAKTARKFISGDLAERRRILANAEWAIRHAREPEEVRPPTEAEKASADAITAEAIRAIHRKAKEMQAAAPVPRLPAAEAIARRRELEPPLSGADRQELAAEAARVGNAMGGLLPRPEGRSKKQKRRLRLYHALCPPAPKMPI